MPDERCNDCGTEFIFWTSGLRHDCSERRARLALVQMSAETIRVVLWAAAMAVCCVLAVYAASRGDVFRCTGSLIVAVFAFIRSRQAARRADDWGDKARRELGVEE